MNESWDVDPKTGDYVMESGVPKKGTSLLTPAYFRMKAKRGTWMYAPDSKWGSDFHLVTKRVSVTDGQFLESVAEKALQPMIDDGRASEVTITTAAQSRHNTGLEVELIDAQGDAEQLNFDPIGA